MAPICALVVLGAGVIVTVDCAVGTVVIISVLGAALAAAPMPVRTRVGDGCVGVGVSFGARMIKMHTYRRRPRYHFRECLELQIGLLAGRIYYTIVRGRTPINFFLTQT